MTTPDKPWLRAFPMWGAGEWQLPKSKQLAVAAVRGSVATGTVTIDSVGGRMCVMSIEEAKHFADTLAAAIAKAEDR